MRTASQITADIAEIIDLAQAALERDCELHVELRIQCRLAAYLAFARTAHNACVRLTAHPEHGMSKDNIERLFACKTNWRDLYTTLLDLGRKLAYHTNCALCPEFR